MEMAEKEGGNDESLKLAVAISLLRSKVLNNNNEPGAPSNDALRWKRKAKERKQEILRLREDLNEALDASHCDLFPASASCKCYFFDNLGQLNPNQHGSGSDARFNDVLRRRFLRQVRFKERRRRVGSSSSSKQRLTLGLTEEDETEQLKASVDFLVDLCDSVDDSKFANLAHQAEEFILVTLKNLLSNGRNLELIEGIINSLVTRLVRKMCLPLSENGSQHSDANAQYCIQHLIRKLGSEGYIGQRAILSVCQRILVLADRLLFSDPFDDAFPDMHESMFLMIQLIEFMVSDYLLEWSKSEDFDKVLLEDWVSSIIQAKKALELLESRNGLYVLYMDRVTGELAKQFGRASLQKLIKQDIFNSLLH
ncbi:protein MULTIPOLAR SPINDLE 1 isoform X1 [Arachis duranensis]|uniref:Protein MULTIPOLAR SPINDLE 1 isoform X1 n=1 Tax=Arachis duranensis TaxID=130453 RepID=A0A6P4BXY2_ARADU|nr:protein MULTIPOLAR SPINDLE 1 isoform X1 [Arachis duranensis]XP_025607529.1 protein MULTIPOLAR SPINDLE 1 isoform X2 [Arachis hypogaea]